MLSRSGHEILTHPNFVCKVLHSTSYTWCIWCAQQTFLSARNWWPVDSSDLLVHMWSTQWWDLWWVCLGLSTSIIFIYFQVFNYIIIYIYIYVIILKPHVESVWQLLHPPFCWRTSMIQKCEWQELFQLLKAADPEARNVIGFWMILGIFGDCPINNDKPITFCFYELCVSNLSYPLDCGGKELLYKTSYLDVQNNWPILFSGTEPYFLESPTIS